MTTTATAPSGDGHGAALLLGTATTDTSTVTAVTNDRTWVQAGYAAIGGAKSDADVTLADTEHTCRTVRLGWTGWTGAHNVVAPTWAGAVWDVVNATGYVATVKTAGGTGVAIADGKAARVLCDGVNVVRLTADC